MYKKIIIFSFVFFFKTILLLFLLNSCSEEGTNPQDEKFVFPDSNVSFYEHVEPLFQVRCGFEGGCHSPTDIENRLPYIVLVNKTSLINHQIQTGERLVDLNVHRSNPEIAPLYLILSEGYPEPFYDQMPPPVLNQKPLTNNQIDGIKQWIKEGAKD